MIRENDYEDDDGDNGDEHVDDDSNTKGRIVPVLD
jgi:hypothetical protein